MKKSRQGLLLGALLASNVTPTYANFFEQLGWEGHSVGWSSEKEYTNRLSSMAHDLARQIKNNQRESRGEESTVVMASVVNLENPNEANRIGLALSNSMIHALQVQGYRAIDFHLRKVMKVTQGGDFVTSNSVNELRNSFDITYMVTGTLSEHRDGLVVTLRMVDWETGVVVSTAETHLTTAEYFGLMSDMEIARPVVQMVRETVPQPVQRVVKLRRPAPERERR